MKIFAYMRVSSAHQVDGDGFTRQRDTIEKWAAARGGVAGWIRDEGVSGTKESLARPGLSGLMAAIAEWKTLEGYTPVAVVVERPDRLARDLIVGELILQEFVALGVTVFSADGDLDLTASDDPMRKLVRQIMSAISEFDKSSIVQKLRKARERHRAKHGRCEGDKPFGWKTGEQNTLQRIMSFSSSVSADAIANMLNASPDYPTRSGRPWSRGTVDKIIRRERARRKALDAAASSAVS